MGPLHFYKHSYFPLIKNFYDKISTGVLPTGNTGTLLRRNVFEKSIVLLKTTLQKIGTVVISRFINSRGL